MTDAVGYTRLSQDSDTSIEKQQAQIREYASDRAFDLVEIFNDGERSSGYDSSREQYGRMVDRVRDGAVDAVVVRDTTRLGRDYDDRQLLQIHMRKQGVELHDTKRGEIDIQDEFLAGVEGIKAAADDQRKRLEIEKSREATEQRLSNGCFHGKPPLGLQFAPDNCHLQKDEREWQTVCNIIEKRKRETNVLAVAQQEGVSTATVSRVADRGYQWYSEKLDEYGK